MKKIIFAVIVMILSNFNISNAAVLEGATEYNGHYYKIFFKEMSNWEDAKYFCQSMGGHLATIETIDEMQFITSLAKNIPNKKIAWIGGYRDNDGFFRWVNGKIITNFNFKKGFPNQYADKHIVINSVGEWGNKGTMDYTPYIFCEWDSADSARESNW